MSGIRVRGVRGGVVLAVDAAFVGADVRAALAPHAGVLRGKVILEIVDKIPFETLAELQRAVAALGGSVLDVRPPASAVTARQETVIVPRTVRSGGRVVSSGSLVVLGDVNPGAELIADGDVIVTGQLRGLAHAGAGGNERAVIYADQILANQLRIAGALALAEEGVERELRRTPEYASLRGGAIEVRPWPG
jgi:septum site-determining protein MinC